MKQVNPTGLTFLRVGLVPLDWTLEGEGPSLPSIEVDKGPLLVDENESSFRGHAWPIETKGVCMKESPITSLYIPGHLRRVH